VAELVDEAQTAGRHETVFSAGAASLQRGIYFIRMEVNDDVTTISQVVRVVYVR